MLQWSPSRARACHAGQPCGCPLSHGRFGTLAPLPDTAAGKRNEGTEKGRRRDGRGMQSGAVRAGRRGGRTDKCSAGSDRRAAPLAARRGRCSCSAAELRGDWRRRAQIEADKAARSNGRCAK
eukprot:IDg9103t1